MKQRYNIIEKYFGKYESKTVIAITDDLMHAVRLVENLNKANENTCWKYDFEKIHHLLDPIKDYYPGKNLFSEGTCFTCINYKEYIEQKKEWENKEN